MTGAQVHQVLAPQPQVLEVAVARLHERLEGAPVTIALAPGVDEVAKTLHGRASRKYLILAASLAGRKRMLFATR